MPSTIDELLAEEYGSDTELDSQDELVSETQTFAPDTVSGVTLSRDDAYTLFSLLTATVGDETDSSGDPSYVLFKQKPCDQTDRFSDNTMDIVAYSGNMCRALHVVQKFGATGGSPFGGNIRYENGKLPLCPHSQTRRAFLHASDCVEIMGMLKKAPKNGSLYLLFRMEGGNQIDKVGTLIARFNARRGNDAEYSGVWAHRQNWVSNWTQAFKLGRHSLINARNKKSVARASLMRMGRSDMEWLLAISNGNLPEICFVAANKGIYMHFDRNVEACSVSTRWE